MKKELDRGNLKRMSVVIKSAKTGIALERFLVDVAYGEMAGGVGGVKDVG